LVLSAELFKDQDKLNLVKLGYDGLVYGKTPKKPLDLKVVKSGQK
jgi:hypothetical protein